jgi:hypothetical protein
MVKGKNIEKIFNEASKYFVFQGFSLVNQNIPSMLIFERGSPYRFALKKAYTKLTVSIGYSKDTITIKCNYDFPHHMLLLKDRNKLTKEIEDFHSHLLNILEDFEIK